MKTTRIVLASLVLAGALTSCTGTAAAPAAPPAADASAPQGDAPSVATTADEVAVESTFLDYYQALVARDFGKACALSAPETKTKLVESIKSGGGNVGTCEEAFSAVYAIPGAGDRADAIAKTTKVEEVTVDGEAASIRWSAEASGKRQAVNSGMRRLDGQWLLLGATP